MLCLYDLMWCCTAIFRLIDCFGDCWLIVSTCSNSREASVNNNSVRICFLSPARKCNARSQGNQSFFGIPSTQLLEQFRASRYVCIVHVVSSRLEQPLHIISLHVHIYLQLVKAQRLTSPHTKTKTECPLMNHSFPPPPPPPATSPVATTTTPIGPLGTPLSIVSPHFRPNRPRGWCSQPKSRPNLCESSPWFLIFPHLQASTSNKRGSYCLQAG